MSIEESLAIQTHKLDLKRLLISDELSLASLQVVLKFLASI